MVKVFLSVILLIFINFCYSFDNNDFETFIDLPYEINGNLRNAIIFDDYKWPNGIIPYVISNKFNAEERKNITDAMVIINEKTCIRFVEKTDNDIEHIHFERGHGGCGSLIGYRQGNKKGLPVTLSEYCLTRRGTIQHELFHVIGLFHEQNRPDRDEYIHVLWDNIEPQNHINFIIIPNTMVETFNLPYDYGSIMHYPLSAAAKTGKNISMIAKQNINNIEIGLYKEPSSYDLIKVNYMYKCEEYLY